MAAAGALVLAGVAFGRCEARTSTLQAALLSRLADAATFELAPGPSPRIRFPDAGPYDVRHGYTRIPAWSERLAAAGYEIEAQARFSPTLRVLAALGLPAPRRESAR
ncbi:MAG TPA: glycosyl transferase family 51, partial [Myxococcota bacterium]|nr:glycosyl transferase family 51 [Myxococcota bacterium]